MRVLITGGAGFVGHHLIHQILERTDWDIVSLDRLDTSGTLARLSEVLDENKDHLVQNWKDRLQVVWHDLKAPVNDFTAEKIGKVDYIFHLAAGFISKNPHNSSTVRIEGVGSRRRGFGSPPETASGMMLSAFSTFAP